MGETPVPMIGAGGQLRTYIELYVERGIIALVLRRRPRMPSLVVRVTMSSHVQRISTSLTWPLAFINSILGAGNPLL